jgi:hypothetical protein
MAKNKKSLLSVAAAVAISSTLLSAAYLPLTNVVNGVGNSNNWVLVGMSAYGGDNTASAGAFSVTDDAENVWVDIAEFFCCQRFKCCSNF